jgi:hypothetical protein
MTVHGCLGRCRAVTVRMLLLLLLLLLCLLVC